LSESLQTSWSLFKEKNFYDFESLLKIYTPICLEFKFIFGLPLIRISIVNLKRNPLSKFFHKEIDLIAILYKMLNSKSNDPEDIKFISRPDKKREMLIENNLCTKKISIELNLEKILYIQQNLVENNRISKISNKNSSFTSFNLISRIFEYFQIFNINGSIKVILSPFSDLISNNLIYSSNVILKLNFLKGNSSNYSIALFNSALKQILKFLDFTNMDYTLKDESSIFNKIKSKITFSRNIVGFPIPSKTIHQHLLMLPLELIPEYQKSDMDILDNFKILYNNKLNNEDPKKLRIGYKIKPGWIPYPFQYIDKKDLSTHISCFGLTSQGKSRFIYNLLHQLSRINIKFLIFDLKGEYLQSLDNKSDNLYFYKIGSKTVNLYLNIFDSPQGFDKEDHINFLHSLFFQVIGENATPQMIRILHEAIKRTVLEKGNFKNFMFYLKNPKVLGLTGAYLELSVAGLLNRILPLTSGISGRCFNVQKSNIDYHTLMNNDVIIDLSLFEETENNIVRKILVNMIYYYYINFLRRKRGKLRNPESIKNAIVVEEAQKIVPSSFDGRNEIKSPLGMSTWTARAYGVSMIFIGTDPIIESSIITNTGVTLLFYGKYDLHLMSKQLNVSYEYLKEILPILRERQMFLFCNKSETQLCKSFGYVTPSKESVAYQYFNSIRIKKKF
jgi:hypothetical protein